MVGIGEETSPKVILISTLLVSTEVGVDFVKERMEVAMSMI
jgi:hypothetical protein